MTFEVWSLSEAILLQLQSSAPARSHAVVECVAWTRNEIETWLRNIAPT
jgi:hypothetical protein